MQFPVIITGIGVFLLLGVFGIARQKWRAQQKKRFKKTQAEENLRIVRENRYQAKKICNANERAAYTAACAVIWERQRKERVFVQVSLGEIIMHPHGRVHAAINSKRVDLLVTDEQFNALIAIEIDGSGHYLTHYSHINDEGKTLALRSAGIPLLRVSARQDNHEDIKRQVQKGLEQFFAKRS